MECGCPLAGWCERHKFFKGEHLHKLCRTRADYRRLWDKQARDKKSDHECVHRGDTTGETHVCEPCGIRGTIAAVYACSIKGKAVIRWWTNLLSARRESGETACLTCRERELSDGSKPYQEFEARQAAQQTAVRVVDTDSSSREQIPPPRQE